MPRISQYVEAPLQGISQADPEVRIRNQAEDLWNSTVEIPDGWRKRPPLEYRGKVFAAAIGSDFYRTLIPSTNSGEPDTYWTVGADKVSRLTNAETLAPITHTVSASAQAYLNALTSPVEDIRTVTVEDYTFIANRKVPLALDPTSAPTRPFEAIVWVKLSDYGRKFVLNIAGLQATYIGPDGGDAADAKFIDTAMIMTLLLNGGSMPSGSISSPIGAGLTAAGFTYTQRGSLLFLSRPADFSITISDGLGGTAMVALKGSTPRLSDLPANAPNGFTIRLTGGSTGSNNDDYFVRFEATGITAGGNTGVWKETIQPGASYGLDPAKLPIGLRYDQTSSTWTLDTLPWSPREVGNAELAPDPLTVGDFIQDIGWFRGRLRFISTDVVLYAGAANPFRIYPSTLTTLTDSDPIQLVNPGEKRAFFTSGRTFDQRDVIFGTGLQGVVSSEGAFTLKTARMDILSEYPFSNTLPLVPAGDNVHFTMKKGEQFDGLWELSINGPLQRTQGEDLTVAQPRLLPIGLNRHGTLKGSFATLYAKHGEPNLYLHLYRYAGQERIQSGFFRWGVPEGWTVGDIISGQNDTKFRLGLLDPDGILHDVQLDLASKLRDSSTSTILTTLDLRMTDTAVVKLYDPDTDATTVTHSTLTMDDTWKVAVRGDGQELPEGMLATSVGTDALLLQGDWSDIDFYVGLPYDAWWDLTTIHHFGPDERVLTDGGDLNLRQLNFVLGKSAFMGAQVQVGKRPPRKYETPQTNFDEPSLFKGTWSVSAPGKNTETTIRVFNDSHLQGYVLGFTWIGEHNLRSQSQG